MFLNLFLPMFPSDPPKDLQFSVLTGIKRKHWEEKG